MVCHSSDATSVSLFLFLCIFFYHILFWLLIIFLYTKSVDYHIILGPHSSIIVVIVFDL